MDIFAFFFCNRRWWWSFYWRDPGGTNKIEASNIAIIVVCLNGYVGKLKYCQHCCVCTKTWVVMLEWFLQLEVCSSVSWNRGWNLSRCIILFANMIKNQEKVGQSIFWERKICSAMCCVWNENWIVLMLKSYFEAPCDYSQSRGTHVETKWPFDVFDVFLPTGLILMLPTVLGGSHSPKAANFCFPII